MELVKQYFVKSLPVPGKIKHNDRYLNATGQGLTHEMRDTEEDENEWQEKAVTYGYKLLRLFLCSRDVQAGDKYYIQNFYNENIWQPEGENWKLPDGCFKVVGEISAFALLYVKEGDDYNEDNIRYSGRNYHSYYPNQIETHSESKYINVYLIKGPCGHYH